MSGPVKPRLIGSEDMTVVHTDTLHEAVRAVVLTGCIEPVEIVARLSNFYGQKWLLRQLVNIVATLAITSPTHGGGGRLGVVQRTGLPRVQKLGAEFLESSRWVNSDIGWRRVSDLTANDCREISRQYDLLASVAVRHRDWFEDTARVLDESGALTVGEIKGELTFPTGALPLEIEA